MIRRTFIRLLASLGLVVLVLLPATPAAAVYNPFANADCAKASDSAICQSHSTTDPISTNGGVIHNLTNLVAVIGGAVAVIVMVVGGIRYITSNGDAEQVSKAKRSILYAAIGIVIIAVAQGIIKLVISGVR